MSLIIIHKNKNPANNGGNGLLRFAVSSETLADIVLDGLSKTVNWGRNNNTIIGVPKGWRIETRAATTKIIQYKENIQIHPKLFRKTKRNLWFIVSNGCFATQVGSELLHKVLDGIQADVVAINVEPELLGKSEKVRFTAQSKVAGFRRLYTDSAEPVPIPADWPHHIFIKTNVLEQVLVNQTLPLSFSTLLKRCRANMLSLKAINIGGNVLDLETEEGLLNFCQAKIRNMKSESPNSNMMSPCSRLIGKVMLGKNIHIGPKTIMVGQTIIGNNVRIGSSAIIESSIIGPGVCVPQNQVVQNRIIKGPQCNWKRLNRYKSNNSKHIGSPKFDLNHQKYNNDTFRSWPKFTYPACFKKIADIIAAMTVLILFAPVLPIIALVIKLTSRGPVFFKDKRQGLHGKEFNCLKFRSMIVGADEIQDKLRRLNEVDGDHYKMEDDPRISRVGGFLRDTHIDEVPQFFNVLLGQMSVVGPRPSPESENTQCPSWCDARLSVRPGITGLWQICRTREPMKDFQEWIYYDTQYVRDLSLKMDLWICWQTIKKMVGNFVKQF
ncbi:MAG: sugar transferase [Planctomycetes bacterium]|nr:sugar transferase [Planctomycetota bacterium]